MKKTARSLIVFWIIVSLCFALPTKAVAQTSNNIFLVIQNTLMKLIWTVFPTPPVIPADVGDTVRDLVPDPDWRDLNQPTIGKPMPNNAGQMNPIVCNGSITHQFSWWDNLLSVVFQTGEESRAENSGGWLKGFIANHHSPKVADMVKYAYEEIVLYRRTLQAYLSGKNSDPESQLRVSIGCVVRGDCGSDDNLKYAGANDKLKPFRALNPEETWKESAIAEREWLLCHTLSGYRRSIFGAPGNIDPYHDYYAGFISSTGQIFAEPPAGLVTRPLYGIEILCESGLSCANQGISDSEKNTICTDVMGPGYASGRISPTSVLGNGIVIAGQLTPGVFNPAQQAINTPSLSCLMTKGVNCGQFYMLPTISNEYSPGTMTEQTQRLTDYPRNDSNTEQQKQNNPDRTRTISVPMSAVDSLFNEKDKGLANLLSSQEQLTNMGQGSDYTYEIAGCTNPVDVGGTVAVPTGGGFLESVKNDVLNFIMGLHVPPDLPQPAAATTLAATDTIGQVLQGSAPPIPVYPSPTPVSIPSGCIPTSACGGTMCTYCSGYVYRDGACCPPLPPPPKLVTRDETRGITNTRYHSKLVENTRNGALLSCRQFLLPELAKQINTAISVNGFSIAPKDFPQGETLSWLGDSSGVSSTYIPLAGVAPFLWDPAGGLCKDLLTKLYDPSRNPEQAYNAGTWLKDMADNTSFLNFVENPMGQLASFQSQNSNLSQKEVDMVK